jgi:hypothetical protein
MSKHFPVRASLKAGSWAYFGIFAFLTTLNHFCGMYKFWGVSCLAAFTGAVMGGYTYWRLRRKPADENGRVEVGMDDSFLRTIPLLAPALNAKHPFLAPILRTGLYLACAVFTLFTVLSHLGGAPDFGRAFGGAAVAGAIGLFEGYRRLLHRQAKTQQA